MSCGESAQVYGINANFHDCMPFLVFFYFIILLADLNLGVMHMMVT